MIYFAQAPSGGPIKIGQTIRLSLRLAQLLAEHGQLVVLAILDGGFPEENALHRRFASLRQQGEWFQPDEALLDFIRQNGRSWDGTDEISPDRPVYVRVNPQLAQVFNDHVETLRPKSSASAVVEMLIERYLAEAGLWPPPPADPS